MQVPADSTQRLLIMVTGIKNHDEAGGLHIHVTSGFDTNLDSKLKVHILLRTMCVCPMFCCTLTSQLQRYANSQGEGTKYESKKQTVVCSLMHAQCE